MTLLHHVTVATLAALAALAIPTARDHPGGRIERLTTLATARSVHTATRLPSGELLVAGGMGSGEGSLASAEILDGKTGRVRAASPLNQARSGHTATALADGRVVVIGGYDGSYLASVEVFDPSTERFGMLGRLREGRSGHTATLLADGRILVAGGVGRGWTFLSSAELFDPRTGSSEPVGPLGHARESHTATLLADGRVLIVGGHRGRRVAMEVYASAERYDPVSRRFSPVGAMTTARHKHDAARLADGRVLVLGGADRTDRTWFATTELYDPATASFGPGPAMASPRYKIEGTAILLPNHDLLVPTGARRAELLDSRRLTFQPVAGEFPAGYAFATATLLAGGDVLIVGGYGPGIENTDGVWRFEQD